MAYHGERDHLSDWMRARSWDLYTRRPDGTLALITRLSDLRALLERQGYTLRQFMDLPAAQPMPALLRRAVEIALERGEE